MRVKIQVVMIWVFRRYANAALSKLFLLLFGVFTLSACSISASVFSENLRPEIQLDSGTDPTYINDSNQGDFPITGSCPKEAKELVLETPVTLTFSCVDGRFSGSLDLSSLPEGEHVFVLRPDVGDLKTWVVVKDTAPPIVKLDPVASFINLANVSAFAVSGTCSESDRFVYIKTDLLSFPVWCSSGNFSGIIDISSLAEGAVVLTATLVDAAGNEAFDNSSLLQKDTIRPGIAVLGNLPPSPSPHISLNSAVSGIDVTEYAFKIGLANDTICSDTSVGYSLFTSVVMNLAANISALADTTLKLCVWTQDIAGNRQLASDIYEYIWVKDSTMALATISAFIPHGNLSNDSEDRSVSVGGINITEYKAVVLYNQATCSSADFSGAAVADVDSDFTFAVGGDGTYLVCIIGKNIVGNWQRTDAATASDLLTIDRVPPSVMLTSKVPDTFNTSSFTVTATFSENVTNFGSSDVVVTNGAISDFAGSGTNYTFTVTPSTQGLVTVAVNAGVAIDVAGNNNTAATNLTRIYDTIVPTAVLSGGATDINGAFVATLTFSEAVTGVDLSDFVVANAVLTGLSGGPSTYTVTVTPVADGAVSLKYLANKSQDAGGNNNTASESLNLLYDGTPPTVSLSSIVEDPFKDPSFAVTATFSEPVSLFAATDINVTNGTVSGFSGSGASYTFTVTPTAPGLVKVVVAAGVAIDAAGNGNIAAISLTRTYDNVAPTITLASASAAVFNSDSISVTAMFSESVTGFLEEEIIVTNGTVSDFSGSGAAYSFTVTPVTQGALAVEVAAGVATDAAGNKNIAAISLTRTYDTVAPTVTLASTASNPTDMAIPVTVVFSESVVGFTAGDMTITNGIISGFTGSGTSYSFMVTPMVEGLVTIDLAAGAATDAAGNGNAAAASLSRTYDLAPTITGLSNDSSWVKSKTWTWGCSEPCAYRYLIDTNANAVPTGTYTATTTATQATGSGTYYLHVQAKDSSENTSLFHVSAKIDNTNPNDPSSVVDGNYSKSLTVSPTITFSPGSDTHSGLARHEARVVKVSGGTVMKDWSNFTSGNTVSGLALTTNTSYRVEIRAVDLVGNISTVAPGDGWLADTTAPTMPTGLATGSVPFNLSISPTLTWTASTDVGGSGVSYYEVKVFRTSGNTVVKDWTVLASGGYVTGLSLELSTSYYFKVRSYDNAGNVSAESASAAWTTVSDLCLNPTVTPGTVCAGGGAVYLGTLSPGATGGSGTNRYMTTKEGFCSAPTICHDLIPNGGSLSWKGAGVAADYDHPNLTNHLGLEGIYGDSNKDDKYGDQNTTILASITETEKGGLHQAAKNCHDLVWGGYSDWYLPNRYELNLLYEKRSYIPRLNTTSSGLYWSSTEQSDKKAWAQRFSDGYQMPDSKSDSNIVRCVRRF